MPSEIRCLILDTETTGRDVNNDRIIELGTILYDPIAKEKLAQSQAFLYDASYPEITTEIEEITSITNGRLHQEGQNPELVLKNLVQAINQCHYVIAFNKSFDENILRSNLARYNLAFPATPWICALREIPYPEKIRGKMLKLQYLLTEHQIEILSWDYSQMHSALGDCELLLKILKLYNWQDIIDYQSRKTIKVKSLEPYDRKDDVKAAGFRWDSSNKIWFYECDEAKLPKLQMQWQDLNIQTQVLR